MRYYVDLLSKKWLKELSKTQLKLLNAVEY